MQIRKISLLAIVLGLGLFLINVSLAAACDPEGDNFANGTKDPRCRLVLPAIRAQQPARAPSAPVAIASAGNLAINSAGIGSGASDYTSNLGCFLPDGANTTNALGIGEACPLPFLPPRAVKAVVTPIPAPALAVTTTITRTQLKGDTPHTARTMTGEWETIDPRANIWYQIDNKNNFYLDIWMDTYGKPGVTFSVYSPEQSNNLSAATSPKGRNSTVKSDPTHDWWWRGAQATGIWHVMVTNITATPMQYRIGNKQSTEDRNCRSYWEFLPTGQYVLWTACR
jgi:hypothetical protein